MVMFARRMKEKGILSARLVYGPGQVSALKQRLIEESEALLASLPFQNGSTFTGVIILQTTDGMAGIVVHTGDSLLIHCDLDEPFAVQHTSDNF